MKPIRWIFVPFAAFMGAVIPLALHSWVYSILENWCPWGPKLVTTCSFPDWVSISLSSFWSGVAGALVVVSGTLFAPSHKFHTAIIVYLLGALACFRGLYVRYTAPPPEIIKIDPASDTLDTQIWPFEFVALFFGAVALLLICRQLRKAPPTKPG